MHRRPSAARPVRSAAAVAFALLLIASAVPALAGDSRNVTIGSPSGGVIQDGILTTTTVSAGESTQLTVAVKNAGPQNLNHVTFVIGYDDNETIESVRPPNPAVVPTFPVAFPAGTTVESFTPGPSACSVPNAQGPVTCQIGQLNKGKTFTASLVIHAGASGSLPLKATVKVAENANDNGANTDTFAAEATIDVAARSCTGLFGFLPAGQAKQLATSEFLGGDCRQTIDLHVGLNATTKTDVISVALVPQGSGAQNCGSFTTCFGDAFSLSVNAGQKVHGYIESTFVWTNLPASFKLSQAAIVHTGATATVVVTTSKKDACTAKKTVNCWTSSVLDSTTLVIGGVPTTVKRWTFTVRFPENGFVRGK